MAWFLMSVATFYSLRTIQPISELDTNSKALTFIQAGIASGKSSDSRRTTVNLGVGHRLETGVNWDFVVFIVMVN
jgi:hypothetical protein